MRWRLIFEEFGPNIQHIDGVGNIVVDTLSRFPSTPSENYELSKSKSQCRVNKLFTIGRVENNEYCFMLKLLILQREQQK